MITCYLRYVIDPAKLKEFEHYGKLWIPLVEKFGGKHQGYFLPSEGANNVAAKFSDQFVLLEYFGYLRRDPDEAGYQFWLNKLNRFNGDFDRAEMVKAFTISSEYRARFQR